MFTKELSAKLIKIIDEREITVEALADAIGMTRESMTRIKNGKQMPTLISLEKMCSALDLEPNDLLLNEKSLKEDKSVAKRVNKMYQQRKDVNKYIPICPSCNSLLNCDWENYCSYCGQRLSWEGYTTNSIVVHKKPERKNLGG